MRAYRGTRQLLIWKETEAGAARLVALADAQRLEEEVETEARGRNHHGVARPDVLGEGLLPLLDLRSVDALVEGSPGEPSHADGGLDRGEAGTEAGNATKRHDGLRDSGQMRTPDCKTER